MAERTAKALKEARARVRDLFGERLASKASESFLLAFGRRRLMAAAAGLESTPPAARGGAVVLEFARQPKVSEAVRKAVDAVRDSPELKALRGALKAIKLDQVTRGVMTEVREAGRSEPEVLPIAAAQLLRHVRLGPVRDNFMKVVGPITDEIERGALSFVRRRSARAESRAAAGPASPLTQVCWLNRTVRTRADPRALAEVVADASVERVDLPRRLEAEIDVSTSTVGAPDFREASGFGGKGIIVAVIDSEVALNHPALKGRVVHKQNFTAEGWGNPDAHGTAVAGIVASKHSRFTGVAPEATVYNYKVLATNELLNGDAFDGALAIQQALEDGAHVANCSWGAGPAGDGTSREAEACDQAWGMGLVIVKSAGNRGPGQRTCTTPADAEGVIAVGATDREGAGVQDYSSRGPAGRRQRPHLVAPGGADEAGIISCLTGGGFGDVESGTSYAAPHVAGLVALLLDRDADLTPDECRDLLLGACKALPRVNANTQGKGLVSLARVLEAVG